MGKVWPPGDQEDDPFSAIVNEVLVNWPQNETVHLGLGMLVVILDRAANREATRISELRRVLPAPAVLSDVIATFERLDALRLVPDAKEPADLDNMQVIVVDDALIDAWNEYSTCRHPCPGT